MADMASTLRGKREPTSSERSMGFLRSLVDRMPDNPEHAISLANMLKGGATTALNWLDAAGQATGVLPQGDKSPVTWGDMYAPLGMGAMVAPFSPKNAVGIFGGRLAKTADNAALARAEAMAAEGASRDDIWNQTGWFQGKDGKWRFEIDDSGSAITRDGTVTDRRERAFGELGGLLQHDPLFEAYPNMARVDTRFEHSPHLKGRHVQPESREDQGLFDITEEIQAQGYMPDGLRSVALHEVQHAAQLREGFAPGGNMEQMAARMDSPEAWRVRMPAVIKTMLDERGVKSKMDAYDAWPQIKQELRQRIEDDTGQSFRFRVFSGMDGMDDADMAFERAMNAASSGQLQQEVMNALRQTGTEGYRRLAGEVEARNVQKRMDMTPEERRATPPWKTQDVPDEDQIVRMSNLLRGSR